MFGLGFLWTSVLVLPYLLVCLGIPDLGGTARCLRFHFHWSRDISPSPVELTFAVSVGLRTVELSPSFMSNKPV